MMDPPSRFWSGRRVAITGATGFVGLHLATRLAQLGARVTALVRATSARGRLIAAGISCTEAELTDRVTLAEACRGCELVFHVAGAVDFEEDWERFQRVNVDGTRHVLAAARAAGVRRVVHTSSIVAVGASPSPYARDETAVWNLGPLRVPYVTTKRRAEEIALAASGADLEVVVVNPASVIGPDDFTPSEFGTLCRRFWRRRIPLHFGGGNNFVDVRDVARGHLLAAERGRAGERYILGGHNRSFTAFFGDLARVADRPIFRLWLPDALGAVVARFNDRLRGQRTSRSYLNAAQTRMLSLFFTFRCDKAARELGYRPRPLRQTLVETHEFWMGGKRRKRA